MNIWIDMRTGSWGGTGDLAIILNAPEIIVDSLIEAGEDRDAVCEIAESHGVLCNKILINEGGEHE